tara:strand:- start:1187 stop:2149 length:963 start_codon:yes stop_codon:yes gene_type:complete
MGKIEKNKVLVFGGGRWARQIIKEIVSNFKNKFDIVVVTPNNSMEMKNWINSNNFSSVKINKSIPKINNNYLVSIVANSVKDHYSSAKKSLKNKIPTLVEKPVTLSKLQTKNLIEEAKKNKVKLFSSNILLFSSNIFSFLKEIKEKNKIQSITIHWKDPIKEIRYGEIKKSDLSIPIYADYLPHILPIIWKLTNKKDIQLVSHRFYEDQSKVKLNFLANNILCYVTLDRAFTKRVRVIKIENERSNDLFDFHSPEPELYSNNKKNNHYKPNIKDRPLAKMLRSLFNCAENNSNNHKLDIELSLKTNEMIDHISNIEKINK